MKESIFDIIVGVWLERLRFIKEKPSHVGFLGRGTSVMVPMLEDLYPGRVSTLADQEKDIARIDSLLPVDFLITDYYQMQKRRPLNECLRSWYKLLKEKGLLFFISLGEDTLTQVYDCLGVDKKNSFSIDLDYLAENVHKEGFQELVVSVEKMYFEYQKPTTLRQDLQDLDIFSAMAEGVALSEAALMDVLERKWPKEGLTVSYSFIFSHAIRKMSRDCNGEQVIEFYR